MKLVQSVLRFASVGLSPRSQRLQLVRALFTNPDSGTNSFESPGFGSQIFDDDLPTGDQRISSFYQKIDRLGSARDESFPGFHFNASRRSEVSYGLDEDGMDEKLKEAAYNLEVDNEEVDQEDYAFRPDSTCHPGNTYEPKDLDLRRPAIHKTPPRLEFEVTTEM